MTAALIKLHVSVLLAGFTGLFGKWIGMTEYPIVWWRVALTVAMMIPFMALRGRLRRYSVRNTLLMLGVGALQCLHWVLFYASIQKSTVSVALVCISLLGLFTALLSPVLLRTRFSGIEVLLGLLCVAGVALIFHFDTQYRLGITIGVISSFLSAVNVVLNKKINGPFPKDILFTYEMIGGLIALTVCGPLIVQVFPAPEFVPHGWDLFGLCMLAFWGTVVLYIIQLQALAVVTAFTVNISLNLEPVYSIILASIFLGESKEYTWSFYTGLAIILLSVALQTLRIARADRPWLLSSKKERKIS